MVIDLSKKMDVIDIFRNIIYYLKKLVQHMFEKKNP